MRSSTTCVINSAFLSYGHRFLAGRMPGLDLERDDALCHSGRSRIFLG